MVFSDGSGGCWQPGRSVVDGCDVHVHGCDQLVGAAAGTAVAVVVDGDRDGIGVVAERVRGTGELDVGDVVQEGVDVRQCSIKCG